MMPPAVEISIIKPAPGLDWEYIARVNGATVAVSAGLVFDHHPGRALQSAIEGIAAALEARRAVSPAPTIEGADHV